MGESHGDILVYIKNGIPDRHRTELINIECLWVEVNVRNKRVLMGTFYRPPNSLPLVLTDIENSIGVAVDTGISDIVILGDTNISPDNLSSLVPQSIETTTHYILRDATNIRQPLTRTQLYYNSSSIRLFEQSSC